MDLGFIRRAEAKFAGRSAARLDYGLLLAMLRAHQTQSGAARAELLCGQAGAGVRDERPEESLIEILLGGSGWRQAVTAREGCFNPSFARFGNAT